MSLIHDLTDEQARAALPQKWGAVEPGVIPAYVAEMDFAPAPVVRDVVVDAVRRGVTGYPTENHAAVGAAFAGFAERHWGWAPPADATVVTGDVIGGIRLVLDVLCPPGPVALPLPCYPPFREILEVTGRELVPVLTDPDADTATMDPAALEAAFEGGARTLLLCSPHNPLGRVWTRAELETVRDLTTRLRRARDRGRDPRTARRCRARRSRRTSPSTRPPSSSPARRRRSTPRACTAPC